MTEIRAIRLSQIQAPSQIQLITGIHKSNSCKKYVLCVKITKSITNFHCSGDCQFTVAVRVSPLKSSLARVDHVYG